MKESIKKHKSYIEIALIIIVGYILHFFSSKYDLLEKFIEFSENYENYELDEILIIFIYLSIVLLLILTKQNKKLIKQEHKLTNNLNEKSLLLKEVNHRIKNNISSIEGLLEISEENIIDIESKKEINNIINRVKCFRIIYQKLTYSKQNTRVDIKEYLDNLISSILKYSADNSISLEVDILEMTTHIDDAIPIGMLINELLTNSLKHCNAEKKKIVISLKKINDDMVLTVNDNGDGYSTGTHEDAEHLGMILIKGFTNQLAGNFSTSNTNGFSSILSFRLNR